MGLRLRTVLNQEVLEQVRYRTREGMKTVAKHGRVPGGICYGYRVRREFDDSGEPVRGLRSIDTNEAATIVWIFEQYADGMSPVRIAEELNARSISGPRGRPGQGTAIRGHRNRGSGILNNQAYIGRIIFKPLAHRKNPTTERRVSRENAAEHHVVQEAPSLRIVDDALWQRVKMRQEDWRTS
ncbi:MAG: recombinase family protein [Pseudorhizobium sp.]